MPGDFSILLLSSYVPLQFANTDTEDTETNKIYYW